MMRRWVVMLLLAACAAPAPGADGVFRIVFFTDVHGRTEWEVPAALSNAAAAIAREQPDLVIGGGDYITDGFEAAAEKVEPRWKVLQDFFGALPRPLELAIGNHDLVAANPEDGSAPAEDPRAIFREKTGIGQTYRSFDAGGYHFILLDAIEVTRDELQYRGFVSPEQMEWVKADLAEVDAATPVVLVTHMPLLTAYHQAMGGATVAAPRHRVVVNSKEVLDLFARHKLLLVLQGHSHVKEYIQTSRGVKFLTGGAVCGQWWRGPWQGTEEGFMVIELRGGDVWWRYVDIGWEARRPENE